MNFTSKPWLWKVGEVCRGGVSPPRLTKWRSKSVFCRPRWCSGKFYWSGYVSWTYNKIGVGKYLRESCYHCIECSVANSLAALMWRWYLNSNFQTYSYYQRLQEGANGTSINISNLPYTWRERGKKEGSVKQKGDPEERDWEIKRKTL